jgi:hypothetical protein
MKKLLLILTACAVGIAFSVFATSQGRSSQVVKVGCEGLVVPENADYNLAYDPVSGDLNIEYVDSAGNSRLALVDSRAAACKANKGVAQAIAHAVAAARDVAAGDCASFEQALAGGKPIVKGGRTANPAAVRDYVATNCR